LLEDFELREKIFHFDHERIPERVVHARGSTVSSKYPQAKCRENSTYQAP
jgi:catalase